MKQNKKDLDAIIDNAARSIREEEIDQSIVNQSATRVWARISQQAADNSLPVNSNLESPNLMNSENNSEQIRGCDDFQSIIPAYLKGDLSPARALLLEDHSNECIPCRRELKEQRTTAAGQPVATPNGVPERATFRDRMAAYTNGIRFSGAARWGFVAVSVLVIGLFGMFMYERLDLSGRTLAATVDNTNGLVYVVSDAPGRPLVAGEWLQKGEHVRTGKDSNAVLRLADGSTVEMRERSEFSVSENMRGVTIKLDRGDVIVEAAKQHNGRLYVETPDSLVSVKGTIFAVESGTKGSRVSVVEGEVKVDHAGKEETLLPGDQTTTNANLDRTSVQENVAWSRNASRYANLVSDLAKLRQDLNHKVARPGVRYSSKFLDLVPENTVFYAGLPNLSESLAESQRIMQERIKQNPALAEWKKGNGDSGFGIDEHTLKSIREIGSQLGDEIVISAGMNANGEPDGVLVMGELKNAAGLRTFVDGLTKNTGDMPKVKVIDDPSTETVKTVAAVKSVKTDATVQKNAEQVAELFIWINNDTFVASPKLENLKTLASTLKTPAANGFVASPFHQRIADIYKNGAGLVVAADLQRIVAQTIAKDKSEGADRRLEGFKQLGVLNLRDFIAEQKEVNGKTFSQASLTFNEADRGIASWLAAPGPMGALDYISPNANVVAAFVVKDPGLMADDLLGFLETVAPDLRHQMQEVERQQGFDIRNDFAAPLGGEFAFAIDGPILPTPSWKMILEVYDEAKLQDSFTRAIEKINQFSIIHGKGKLTLETSTSGNRTFYSIKSDLGLEVNYTYANGYLIAAPSRALLEQSLTNRDAGNTLVHSARFMSSLPQDGNTNFSAILYHDLAPLVQSLAERMKNSGGAIAEQANQKLGSIDVNAPPTLAYVYANGGRISIASNTEGGAFGLSPATLVGMPNSFQMQHILMNAVGKNDVKKTE